MTHQHCAVNINAILAGQIVFVHHLLLDVQDYDLVGVKPPHVQQCPDDATKAGNVRFRVSSELGGESARAFVPRVCCSKLLQPSPRRPAGLY
jgi:hypothetical protein